MSKQRPPGEPAILARSYSPPASMRYLALLAVGLLLGAAGASIVQNTLSRRAAYARGVMDVMQHHYAALRERLRDPRCTTLDPGEDRAMLAALTEQIGPSQYGDDKPDAPFAEYTDR